MENTEQLVENSTWPNKLKEKAQPLETSHWSYPRCSSWDRDIFTFSWL